VNVLEDYRRFFQADPPDAQGIALLTDGDNTHSRAVADYDDFRALADAAASDGPAIAGAAPR